MTDKLEPLKPITAKQQDEFDVRREIATVVQNRCTECGAWYETAKRQTAFQEAFRCDCGNPLAFTVPALQVSNVVASSGIDLDERLDSGMKVREAIANACHWWNRTGRQMMRKDGGKGSETSASLNPDNENFIPSGIVNGLRWDELNQRERAQIVKAWHFHHVSNREEAAKVPPTAH